MRFILKAEVSVFIGVHWLSKASDVRLIEGKSPIFCGVIGRTHNIYEAASFLSVLLDLVKVSRVGCDHKCWCVLIYDNVVLGADLHHLVLSNSLHLIEVQVSVLVSHLTT